MRDLTVRIGVFVALIALTSGCSALSQSDEKPSTEGQASAASRAQGAQSLPIVELYLDPKQCLECSSDLPRWQALAKAGRIKLSVVLSEAPSPEQLATMRQRRFADFRVQPQSSRSTGSSQLWIDSLAIPTHKFGAARLGSLLTLVSDSALFASVVDSIRQANALAR